MVLDLFGHCNTHIYKQRVAHLSLQQPYHHPRPTAAITLPISWILVLLLHVLYIVISKARLTFSPYNLRSFGYLICALRPHPVAKYNLTSSEFIYQLNVSPCNRPKTINQQRVLLINPLILK